jgi:nucleoside-triphosphatase THEP1
MGIVMPDIHGSRKILDLQTKDVFDAECTDTLNNTDSLISVGKYHFYAAAFDKANAIVIHAIKQKPDWLVIDEAGKLELEGKGFYPSIKKAIDLFDNAGNNSNLLITVRDSLCANTIAFFNIKNYRIIHDLVSLK